MSTDEMSTDVPSGRPWRIKVTEDCIGAGLCVATAADHFRLVDGYSEPVNQQVAPDDRVLAAAELCPAEAIVVTDEAKGQLLP